MVLLIKNLRKEISDDKRISIAIMSSFIVLIAQYLILYYFNIDNTRMGEIIRLLSKITVGLFFVYSFPIVFKRNGILFILVYCVSIAIFSINYLFFKQNIVYLNDILFKFFFICLPCFIYSYSINNKEIFKNIMEKTALFIFIIGFIIGFLVFSNKIILKSYSMSISYYLLLPTIIYLNKFFKEFSLKSIIFIIISIFIMLAIGSRGAIMCTGVYIILYLMINIRRANAKRALSNIIILVLILFIVIFSKEILMLINTILSKIGIYSRSINLFLEEKVYLSGRDVIYDEIINQIKANPIFGIGLAGDRVYAGGAYSHNIFLEVISGFGVIIGSFILITIGVISIRALFSKRLEDSNLMLIWFCIGFLPLTVSGSYLTEFQFWIFLGLAIRFLKELKENKKKIDYEVR